MKIRKRLTPLLEEGLVEESTSTSAGEPEQRIDFGVLT
jgi:hypothetical protein